MVKSPWCSVRFSVAYGVSVVTLVEHVKRYSIALTVIAMSTDSKHYITTNTSSSSAGVVTYDWDSHKRATVIGAFYYGYAASIFICGQLSSRIGARRGIGFGQLISSCIQFFYSLAASVNYSLLVALRVLDGLVTGYFFVGSCAIIGAWGVPSERGQITTITQWSCWIGIMLGFFLSGFISASDFGWPYVFYCNGIISLSGVIVWYFTGYDCPEYHPRITKNEKHFIQKNISSYRIPDEEKVEFMTSDKSLDASDDKIEVPWVKIVRNKAFIAVAIYHTLFNWAFYYTVATFPQYLHDVHGIEVAENGLLNCLPYLFGLIGTSITGYIVDLFTKNKIMSVTASKKLLLSTCSILLAISFFNMGIWGENLMLTLVMVCVAGTMLGSVLVSIMCNFADISPSFSGQISSLTNTIGCIPGFLAPVINAKITQEGTQQEWMYSYLLTSGLSLLSCACYLIGGSGQIQSFDTKYYNAVAVENKKTSEST